MDTISVDRLTFAHPNQPPALDNVALHLPPGSRTIIVGANGGKPPAF
jgi:CCR4-NOT complex subunit CAF16